MQVINGGNNKNNKVKITRSKAIEIYQTIQTIRYEKANPKFPYALSKNKGKLQPIINEIREKGRPPIENDDYKKFDDERLELCKEMSEKDKDGNPVVDKGEYKVKDIEDFNKKIEALKKKHKSAIEKEDDRKKEYDKFIEEEIEVEFHKINLDLCPENLSVDQMDKISIFIQE